MSCGVRPYASAIAWTVSPIGRERSIWPRAGGPTAIFRMYMFGRLGIVSGSPATTIDIAPKSPRATSAAPSIGSTARSTRSPPEPTTASVLSGPSGSSLPTTTLPSIGRPSSAARIPAAAAASAPARSPRPSQRPAATAARSVAAA